MHVEKGHSINIVLTFNSASGSFEAGRGLRCFKSRHEGSFSQRWAVDLLIPHNLAASRMLLTVRYLSRSSRRLRLSNMSDVFRLWRTFLIERTDLDGLRG